MRDNWGNNINIGNAGHDNTFNVSQTENNNHLEYEVDENSIEHPDNNEVEKKRLYFWSFLVPPTLSFFTDWIGLLDYFSVPFELTLIVALCISIPLFLYNYIFNYRSQKLAARQLARDRVDFFGGKLVERAEDGDYIFYSRSARCIYRGCEGTVYPQPAPEREKDNHNMVGVCNLDNKRHTYTCDNNWIGEPQDFDWRPLSENN